MEEKTELGKFIARKRREKNLTQKDLANKLYVTESAVSKWERGISYPDISLVSSLCEALDISEHELITAGDDLHAQAIEKESKKYQRLIKIYLWTFYILYGTSLTACFIVNLAVNQTLSWFFIVLGSLAVAFSLTTLPVLLKKHKAVITLGAFFGSLNLLLLICSIYTGGDWLGVTFTALLFSFAVVFLPFVLMAVKLPASIYPHKALICFAVDTVLLYLLIFVAFAYNGNIGNFFSIGAPVTAYCLLLPWSALIAVRYLKINALFRTAICLLLSSVYDFFLQSYLSHVIDNEPFGLVKFNFYNWTFDYINGNIAVLTSLVLIVLAAAFAAGGIVLTIRKQNDK